MWQEALIAAVLLGLAVYRVTRLVVKDSILKRPRSWVLVHAPDAVVEAVTCPWCISGWISLALVLVVQPFADVPLWGVVWFASWGVGVIAFHVGETLAELHE